MNGALAPPYLVQYHVLLLKIMEATDGLGRALLGMANTTRHEP